ncbi:hypothetical protein KPA96_13825 [Burkholderia cenocepacia]|uniref:hypothetical protein n=1 Tax=Burkholderia cenocepacia TaxID=95486 RepID=UPI002858A884|nr:hypothetical protein [Burkholderia cenocepacia]MCB4346838.1 hypothetical protein [Burkholderia vietnamiensis]MDR8076736.1 hypothetical protein [Burkholderia cenocepacia]
MKTNKITREDLQKILLYGYKKELAQTKKDMLKAGEKSDKFKVLDYEYLKCYVHKDYSYFEVEKQKCSFNKEHCRKLDNVVKWKYLSDREDVLQKKINDLMCKIYELEKEMIGK